MTNPSQGRVLGETTTLPEARIERMIKSALIIAAGEAFFQLYLHNVLYIFDVNLMGLERNREHLLVVAVQHLLSYLLAVWWLRSHGLVGVAWGLLAGSQVSLLLAGVICSRLGCRLDVAIVTRFGISVAALAAAIGLRDAPLKWRMLSWAGLVAVMLGCILPAHRLHLWQCLRQFTLSPVPR